jgi:hypothetical protein
VVELCATEGTMHFKREEMNKGGMNLVEGFTLIIGGDTV